MYTNQILNFSLTFTTIQLLETTCKALFHFFMIAKLDPDDPPREIPHI